MSFVHLHVHSEYSALDGLIRMKDAFKTAAAAGQTAMAITDHGTLGGIWKAQKYASPAGVKLIPGCEVYLAFGNRFVRESEEVPDDDDTDDSDEVEGESAKTKVKKYMHLTLLAESPEGWRNLVLICNAAEQTKWGKYPRIDYKLLSEHAEGIIVLTGCLGGPVLGPLSRGDIAGAERGLVSLIDAVGRDNVYVEVMEHGIQSESDSLHLAVELAKEHGLSLVATNDAHYTHEHDAVAHDGWLALRTKSVLAEQNRYRFHGNGYHLRNEEEMRALRPEAWWQDAVSNTQVVADRVAARVLPAPEPKLPAFPTPEGFESNLAYYMHLVKEGSKRIYGDVMPDAVRERLNVELAVIKPMGFVNYFLIVEEVITWARTHGILVGPGRGSAAGSMTAYLMGITGIDPLENNLLFERFLEPGRTDFPDIDVDFEASRREDILDHLTERWGYDHVALIGSYGAAKTKRAIKDAARVLEAGSVGTKLAKLVPVEQGNPFTFDDLFDESRAEAAEFRAEVGRLGEPALKVIELAKGFDSAINGVSIHACGVVISDRPLTDLVPLRVHPTTHRLITVWDSKDSEAFGLLKLDVLSLRNLDIMRRAVSYIHEVTGEDIDVDHLPHPNSQGNPRVDAAWALLRDGRTSGIFQMESAAMTNLARQIQPANLTELSAVIALFRPGPLSAGMDQHFAMRKQGAEAIDYSIFSDDPDEQDIIAKELGSTYGTFVFQEQLMLLGAAMAGFDAAGRSKLRRAVGKKDKIMMAQVGEAFLDGCVKEFRNDAGEITSPVFSEQTAIRMWEAMRGSGSYLFNASHSAAYAQLAYITAYLKANWPASYGAAILAETSKGDKRIEALHALPQEGIQVLGPDVNLSRAHSAPEGETTVRIGLSEIKAVGAAGERIVEVRDDPENPRPFDGFYDLVNRVRRGGLGKDNEPDLGYLPSNQIEALIEAGALDAFGPRKGLYMVSHLIKDTPRLEIPSLEWGIIEKSARQRDKLLISLGEHPLKRFQDEIRAWNKPGPLDSHGNQFRSPATPIGALPMDDGAVVTTIGILSKLSEGTYRGGRRANIALEGSTSSINGILWDRALSTAKLEQTLPAVGWPVAASGRITVREFEQEDEEGNVTVSQLKELTVDRFYTVPINDPSSGELPTEGIVVPQFATSVRETIEALPEAAPPLDPPALEEMPLPLVFTPLAVPAEFIEAKLPVGGSLSDLCPRFRDHPEFVAALRAIRTEPRFSPLDQHAGTTYRVLGRNGIALGAVTLA